MEVTDPIEVAADMILILSELSGRQPPECFAIRCSAGKLPEGADDRFVIDIDLEWGALAITDVARDDVFSLDDGVGNSRRLLGSL